MSVPIYVMFVSAIAGAVAYGLNIGVAVYSVSFWHYYVYWLAYVFRAVPHATFKRDAVLMKSVSLAALGWAFFSGNPDILSTIVVTFGFALNAYASVVMGSDRSYYGYEIGGLPFQQITAFPFSITAHPMLTGNIIAFGGTLINTEFREHWWPLAVTHVAMNAGLLIMETTLSARSRGAQPALAKLIAARFAIGAVVLSLCAVIGYVAYGTLGSATGIMLGILISGHAFALYRLYSTDTRQGSVRHNFTDGKAT